MTDMLPQDVVDKARELRWAKDRKEELEAELKSINGAINQLANFDLPRMMEDQEIDKISIAGVGTVYLKQQIECSIKTDQKEVAYGWLAENGHGELIKDYVHPATLKAWAKEQLENNMPIPECISAFTRMQATIRRS